MTRILLLFATVFYLVTDVGATWAQTAPAPEVQVTGTLRGPDLDGHIAVIRDPTGAMQIEEIVGADQFVQTSGRGVDFGYTNDVIWLTLRLRNTTSDITDWRIHFRENFFPGFEVYSSDPDAPNDIITLEKLEPDSPFSDRRVPYAEMVAALDMPSGAVRDIYVRYWSGGSSELTFSIMSEEAFNAFAAGRTAKNFIFYGMMLFLIIVAAVIFAATRQFVFAAYSLYASAGLLFVMHADGNAFQYLWPNAPAFNNFATVVLGTGIIAGGANFARHFLQTFVYHPVLEWVLRGLIAATLLVLVSAFFGDTQFIKKALVLGAFLSVLLFFFSGVVAARTRFREVRFYVLAWAGALVSSAIMTGRHWLGLEISEEVQFNSMRVVFVVDAALMGFAILDRFNQLKRNRQAALEASLAEAQRNLQLSDRLQVLERQYALAVDLADRQQQHIADTVHDLRQPLHALRLSVQALARGKSEGTGEPRASEVEETFAYLERLVGAELAELGPGDPLKTGPMRRNCDAEHPNDEEAGAIKAPVSGDVLGAVQEMFVAEAREKGIDLRVVQSTVPIDLPPLALMRVVSNLVSNAVKYTHSGCVLVGLRRGGDAGLRLEVHDTGPGLDTAGFHAACQRRVRLAPESSGEGSGLGLSIVCEIAEEHGLRVGLVPGRRSGTGVYVTMPSAIPTEPSHPVYLSAESR